MKTPLQIRLNARLQSIAIQAVQAQQEGMSAEQMLDLLGDIEVDCAAAILIAEHEARKEAI